MRFALVLIAVTLIAACEPHHHRDPIEEALAGPDLEDVEKDLGG